MSLINKSAYLQIEEEGPGVPPTGYIVLVTGKKKLITSKRSGIIAISSLMKEGRLSEEEAIFLSYAIEISNLSPNNLPASGQILN